MRLLPIEEFERIIQRFGKNRMEGATRFGSEARRTNYEKIDINQAVDPLDEYARDLGQGPLVLTDGRHAIAALMPIEDEDLESLLLSLNPKFQSLIQKARSGYLAGSSLPAEEIRHELELR